VKLNYTSFKDYINETLTLTHATYKLT
jgi:hypothetical protein